MHDTVSIHQCDAHAVLVRVALLIVTACGWVHRTASGQMSDRVIATTFNVAAVLYAEGTPRKELARCDAPDHHMELPRT